MKKKSRNLDIVAEPEIKKLGRPLKLHPDEKTLATLANLAKIQCTQKEAAGVLGVSEPTFIAFLKLHSKAREAWDNGAETGRASLRRQQFKMSETNAAMAIWLGKQYLGQKDKHELAGDAENPLFPSKVEIVIIDPK
jgi:hypothetical protein